MDTNIVCDIIGKHHPNKDTQININKTKHIEPIAPVEITLDRKKLKKTTYWGIDEFIIYEDGCEIPESTRYLAIEHGHHLPPVFPDSVSWLLLPDGFDCQSLQSLPPTIVNLSIFNIKYKLLPGSIPNSIIYLIFGNGFDQKITKGIIPYSVLQLYICDIVHPLDDDVIPKTVTINTSTSFKHSHPKGARAYYKLTPPCSDKYKY